MDELIFPVIAISLAVIALSGFGLLVALLASNFQAAAQIGRKAPKLVRAPGPKRTAKTVINDDVRSWLKEQDEKTERPV